jgi:hypothetical protein
MEITGKLISIRIDQDLQKQLNAYAKDNRTIFVTDALKAYIRNLKGDAIPPIEESKPIDSQYLQLYIDQLKIRIHQLETEISYWKNSYSSIQSDFQNFIINDTKRNDEKFERIMFILEESKKQISLPPSISVENSNNSIKNKDDKNNVLIPIISSTKKKKGWVFQFFRM